MDINSLSVLQPDLRHKETIFQAANSLFHLQSVITAVFDQIDSRIAKNQLRINQINQRLDVANRKGHKLVELRKATKVLSPSEYTEPQCRDIPKTFSTNIMKTLSPSSQLGNYAVDSKLDPIGNRLAVEKLQFFHVENNIKQLRLNWDGLGAQPHSVHSVDSLLLFKKSQTVYGSYKESKLITSRYALTKSEGKPSSSARNEFERLGAAPPSISNRKLHIHKRQSSDIVFYSPGKYDIPEIDLPMDLPDLPGIADNVHFSSTMQSSQSHGIITTGMMILTDIPDLPELNLSIAGGSPANANSESIPTQNSVTVVDNPISISIPPPPPPPQNSLPLNSVITIDLKSVPPPPPPLPPIAPPTIDAVKQKPKESVVHDRSNLMESIRKAAGKSALRPTEVRKKCILYI